VKLHQQAILEHCKAHYIRWFMLDVVAAFVQIQ